MKFQKIFAWFLTLTILASSVSSVGVIPVAPNHGVTVFLKAGPQAVLSNVSATASPNYGLFTCQVLGLNPTITCYDPYQIRHAYNIDTLINSGFDGKGKTIIIVDAYQSPNIVQQLNYYNSFYGLKSLNGLGAANDPNLGTFSQIAPDGLTPFDPNDGNMIGWAEEISLDVLWAHAMAPGANIVLDLAKSNDDADILSATKFAVDQNLGNVISQSFGGNESCVTPATLKAEHKLFIQATLKHITLVASTGDDGAAQPNCDGSAYVQAASSPASDPLVTAVGGTELHAARYCLAVLGCDPSVNPAPGTYQDEVAWNEFDNSIGTGGGFSVLYKSPFFQRLLTRAGKQRGVPDVAYSAAVYHAGLTYLNIPGIPAGWYLTGGTSMGSPQWAAIVAIADQKAGRSLGFVNAALYLYSLSSKRYSTIFNDVTSGNNTMVEYDINNNPYTVQGFDAKTGWDASTGLGSPKTDQLVNFLGKFTLDDDGKQAAGSTDPSGSGSINSGGHFVESH
jgi:subtilase family serine protease